MKNTIIFLSALLMLSACGSSTEQRAAQKNDHPGAGSGIHMEHLVTMEFEVKGMTCEGCENAVVSNVAKLSGIQEATASHKAATSVVVFDSTLASTSSIIGAITDAGYEVIGEGTPAGAR